MSHEDIIEKYLKPGDTITHERCMGIMEEHIYTGRDGRWLCGKPTKDTIRLGGSKYEVNDISPKNITHINRVPVKAVPILPKSGESGDTKVDPSVLSIGIKELNISKRSLNMLLKKGFKTIGDLLEYTESDLLKIKGFGRRTLSELKYDIFEPMGLKFKRRNRISL